MGLGIASVQNMLELWQQGNLEDINSVIEMGSQELHLKSADFENLLNTACITEYDHTSFTSLDNWPSYPRCSAKPLYLSLIHI